MFLMLKSKEVIGQDNTAYVLVIISTTFWVLGFVIGSQNHKINFAYIGFARAIVSLILNYAICVYYNMPSYFEKSEEGILMKRNVLSTLHSICIAFTMKYIQAPIVHTICNIGPIFVFIIDHLKNQTPISRSEKWGIYLAFIGATLTINSNAILHYFGRIQIQSKFTYIQTSVEFQIILALILVALVYGWAYGVVLTKELKKTNVIQLNLHISYLLLYSDILLNFAYPNPDQITIVQSLWIYLTVGLILALAQLLFIAAIKTSKKSGNVTLMWSSNILVSYLSSLIRYSEQPNILGLIGSICIVVGLMRILVK